MGMIISGIGACETIDSSGEVLKMDGLDISSLERDGLFNYEHESKTASSIVGKILKAKKIFSEKDCENESQLKFWKQVNTPYLWVMGELFDDVGHSEAMNIAAMLRYDVKAKAENKYPEGMSQLIHLSVEGAKLRKEGNIVIRSIARKISITLVPCNKVAAAEIHIQQEPNKSEKKKNGKVPDLSIFKSETYSLPSAEVLESLEKADSVLKAPPKIAPTPTVIGKTKSGKDIGSHPSHTNYAQGFSHEDHKDAMNAHYAATVATKNPKMQAHHMNAVKVHMQAAMRKEPPKKSVVPTPANKIIHPLNTMQSIHGKPQPAKPQFIKPQPTKKTEMKKTLELGSSAGAPASLTGGAALSSEQLEPKAKPLSKGEAEEYNREIVDKGVETWENVQEFRKWLGSRMPSLNKKEAEAFTRAFVMFRTKKAEKKLRDF
jgi:hypothetical protein